MIWMLVVVTFVVLGIVIALINIFEPNEGGVFYTFWDSLSAIINASMPYTEEGDIGYLIPTGIAALFGLLITSVLIGIIANAIEEKINSLKRGNSVVAENGHTVVLGFESGSYELISQLIKAAGEETLCIVVAGDGQRDEAEEDIRSNISIPRNVKLIYRKVDICDATSMKCCSIETSKTVIINSYDSYKAVKAILAVVKLLREYPDANVSIVSSVSKEEYMLPLSLRDKKNICMVQTNDVISRIIAHSCSQPGISQTYLEVLDFNGSEFYIDTFKEFEGLSFGELYQRIDNGVPIGFVRDNKALLKPDQKTRFEENDKLVYLAQEHLNLEISNREAEILDIIPIPHRQRTKNTIIIFGYNEKVKTLVNELPSYIQNIISINANKDERENYKKIVESKPNCTISFEDVENSNDECLIRITENVEHVILLNNDDIERTQSDIENMLLYLKLIDIQITYGRRFNITTELYFENDKDLIVHGKTTDFVVANNMSSLLTAQIACTPELISVYDELLSNEGVEIRVLNPNEEECACKNIYDLRKKAFSFGTILIGYVINGNNKMETHLNPYLDETVNLCKSDYLIGIC